MVGLGRKSYLGQAEIARFCLFRDVRVSSSFPCVTPGVDGVRPSVHRICNGRLFSFLFFAFFKGVGSWITLFFETTFPIIFLMLLNKTSDFTIYVAGCCPFFSLRLFFFFFLGGCQLVTLCNLLIFPFVSYFFSCSLVACHLIFPCGVF